MKSRASTSSLKQYADHDENFQGAVFNELNMIAGLVRENLSYTSCYTHNPIPVTSHNPIHYFSLLSWSLLDVLELPEGGGMN
jgi:hypothetical protein